MFSPWWINDDSVNEKKIAHAHSFNIMPGLLVQYDDIGAKETGKTYKDLIQVIHVIVMNIALL